MPWFILLACSGADDTTYTLPPPATKEVMPNEVTTADSDAEIPPEGDDLGLPPPNTDVPTVTFDGMVEYAGESTGSIELEVLHNAIDQTVNLVAQTTLPELGHFTIEVPSNPQELTIMAYIDLTGDRITDDDPRGYLKVPNATEPQGNLVVTILDLAELEKQKEKMDKGTASPKEEPSSEKDN